MVQNAAPPSSGIDLKDYLGSLVHIDVLEVIASFPTMHGDDGAVRTNWTALDGPKAGTTERDVLIFPKVLQNQLRGAVGNSIAGRIGQGAAQPGKNPAWVLLTATDAEMQAAINFEAARNVQSAQPPAASAAPAAPQFDPATGQPVGQPAPQFDPNTGQPLPQAPRI